MTKPQKQPAIQTYWDAMVMLRAAEYSLDQAHAMLKDIGLQSIYADTGPYYKPTVAAMGARVLELYKALHELQCEECGKPLRDGDCLGGKCLMNFSEEHKAKDDDKAPWSED